MEIKKNRAGNIAFETFCSDHTAAKSAEIYRSTVCEGEIRPEFKVIRIISGIFIFISGIFLI